MRSTRRSAAEHADDAGVDPQDQADDRARRMGVVEPRSRASRRGASVAAVSRDGLR